MPVTLTAPGVYVEEIPSGVRTISGVATSITAFLGRALRGPVDKPTLISSFGDFERVFGGLWLDGPMTYAVRDFFLNGGARALIVRLYVERGSPADDGLARAGVGAGSPEDDITLVAANPGEWGNQLHAEITTVASPPERYGSDAAFYNVEVWEGVRSAPRRREFIRNVSVAESPRRLDRVLAIESRLLRASGSFPNGALATDVVHDFSGGDHSAALDQNAYIGSGNPPRSGLQALDDADLFNLLCIPPDTRDGDVPIDVWTAAAQYCAQQRAMLIVDPPTTWATWEDADITTMGVSGTAARNAAVYYPRVKQRDPLREGQLDTFVPCGIVAGQMASTDTRRGVWKAPAGVDVPLSGIAELASLLNDSENGQLNDAGINCFRTFPTYGSVIWGARTMRGANQLADEYKYIPVRRLALYIEESLYRGTQWVVFEPNDEPLWAQIRLNVGAFMHTLFRQGAFQGSKPSDAYLVKCDTETTTQADIDRGVVNVLVAFAPLKPAEFVVIQLQQLAGQLAT